MKPIIKVENLSKQYHISARQAAYATLRDALTVTMRAPLKWLQRNGRATGETFWALKDVGFEVMPGEVVGIIGRNGAGKSTLLKMLSRIVEPTTGRVELYGRVGSLLEVGTGFHPELTGRENVFLNGAILGMSRREIDNRFDEIVAFAEIEKFLDTPIKYYSSGMYMRLAFAVAAHLQPEILIVDEVLAVGDTSFQKKCLGKMSDVAKEGRTVLFVSHNTAAILSLCSVGIVLNFGKIEVIGSVSDALQHYKSLLSIKSSNDVKRIRGVQVLATCIVSSANETYFTSDSCLAASIDFYTEHHLPKCYLNFVVEDMEGHFLIHSRTDLLGARPSFDPGVHKVTVKVPRLYLRAGMYTLWFRLYVNTGDITETADSERIPLEIKGTQIGGLLNVPCHWSWD